MPRCSWARNEAAAPFFTGYADRTVHISIGCARVCGEHRGETENISGHVSGAGHQEASDPTAMARNDQRHLAQHLGNSGARQTRRKRSRTLRLIRGLKVHGTIQVGLGCSAYVRFDLGLGTSVLTSNAPA
jgi:hypothetical protein